MTLLDTLKSRSNNHCELCKSTDALAVYDVPAADHTLETEILICDTCKPAD